MRHPLPHPASWALCAVLALSACGSSDDDHPPPPPPSAVANADTGAGVWNTAITVDVLANDSAGTGAMKLTGVAAPAHGTAAIEGGKVVYTPAADYFGADEFSYTASDDKGEASATVTLTITAEMTLQGLAYDAPMPGAAIEAKIGNTAFTATADAGGRYALPIQSADPTQFVSLSATGAGEQSKVKLLALLGDTASLAKQLGEGGIVANQQITHLSTAQAALATQAHGGTTPATQADLTAANNQVGADSILQMAAMINLVADGGVPLPAGVVDTSALVMDPAVYQAFEQQQMQANAQAVADARAAIAIDPVLAIAPPPLSEPMSLMLRYGSNCCTTLSEVYTLRPDGSATVQAEISPIAANWTVANGAYVFSFPGGSAVWDTYSYWDSETGTQITETVKISSLVLRQIAGTPGGAGGYMVGRVWTYSYSDGRPDETYDDRDAPIFQAGTPLALMTVPDAAELTAHALAGVPVADIMSDASAFIDQDTAQFSSDGTGHLLRTGTSFQWRVEDGFLKLRYANEEHHLARISLSAQGEQRWLVQIAPRATDGSYTVQNTLESMMASFDSDTPFTEAELPGVWMSYTNRGMGQDGTSGFRLAADHTGMRVWHYQDGTTTEYGGFNWSITTAGILHMVSPSDTTGSSARDWTRRHRSGSTLFVMESIADRWRINRYDLQQ